MISIRQLDASWAWQKSGSPVTLQVLLFCQQHSDYDYE